MSRDAITLFYGPNTLWRDQKIDAWKQAFIAKYHTTPITILASQETLPQMIEELQVHGLFGVQPKLVVIRDPEGYFDGLEVPPSSLIQALEQVEKPLFVCWILEPNASPTSPLLSWVRDNALIKESKIPSTDDLAAYAHQRCEITDRDLDRLIASFVTKGRFDNKVDIGDFTTAIDLLALATDRNETVKKSDIDAFLSEPSGDIFALLDAFLHGTPHKKLEALEAFMRLGEAPDKFLIGLQTNVRTYLYIRYALLAWASPRNVIEMYGLKGDTQLKKAQSAPLEAIEHLYTQLVAIERGRKTGGLLSSQEIGVYHALVDLCMRASLPCVFPSFS